MATSPISTLNKDCFLYTFQIITSQMPRDHQGRSRDSQVSDRPLNTLRAASQVCRQWREILLTCPLIWGRVVDLDVNICGEKRVEWMEEVVRRAGDAPLWISGRVREILPCNASLRPFNTQVFFIRLMGEWERIEKLSVLIQGRTVPDSIQSRFLSRAPILKLFDVEIADVIGNKRECLFLDTLQPGSSRRLFADCAPKLQVIRAKQIAFRLDSSWLPTILEIHPFPICFSLKDIFVILQRTPQIKGFYISTDSLEFYVADYPKLILPNLSDVYLGTHLNVAAMILDHISPGKLSLFHLNALHVAANPESIHTSIYAHILGLTEVFVALFNDSFKKNLPSYIVRCFLSKPSGEVRIVLTKDDSNGIIRFAFANAAQQSSSDTPSFSIAASLFREHTNQLRILTACLAETLLLASASENGLFEPIHGVTLNLYHPLSSTPVIDLYAMLAVFENVRYINIDERSGQILKAIFNRDDVAASDHPHVLFPKLHTVYLTARGYDRDGEVSGLTDLLLQRKRIGYPVTRLDLTKCMVVFYAQDLGALEDVDGLEVVWRRPAANSEFGEDFENCSYICGSGEPQKLRMLP